MQITAAAMADSDAERFYDEETVSVIEEELLTAFASVVGRVITAADEEVRRAASISRKRVRACSATTARSMSSGAARLSSGVLPVSLMLPRPPSPVRHPALLRLLLRASFMLPNLRWPLPCRA